MKKWVVIVITVCIIVSLIIFMQATDIEEVLNSVQRVGFKFGWLLLITGLAYYFATLSWKYCLGDQYYTISTYKLFLIRHVGETVSFFNPASIVGGDALKVIMLSDYKIENKRIVASIILSRLILIVTQLLFFILTVLSLTIQNSGFRPTGDHEKLTGWLVLILTKTRIFRLKTAHFFKETRELLRQNKKAINWSIFFAILHWLFGALEFYLILNLLGIEVTILQALFLDLGVVFFKAAGSFIPGQIGAEEYGNKIMLLAIGIPDAEVWVSASILRRARQLVWSVFGIVVYFLIVKQQNLFKKE